MKKEYLLLILISAILMVFQFLLSKELMYLCGILLSRTIIALVLVGFSLGSFLAFLNYFRKDFYGKILIFIPFSILAADYVFMKFIIPKVSFFHPGSILFSLVFILPFVFFGIYFGRVFDTEDLKKVFLYNGIGLMLGAMASGKVFKYLGWDAGLPIICSLMLVFALFINEGYKKIPAVLLMFVVLLFNSGLLYEKNPVPVRSQAFFMKDLGVVFLSENTELVRTDLIGNGISMMIFTDADAPTPIRNFGVPFITFPKSDPLYSRLPYSLKDYDNALVIGVGGAQDVALARFAGVKDITGVELNPVTIKWMNKDLLDYTGRIYQQPGVKIFQKEGRSFVENAKNKYDLILIQGTDTITASSFVSSVALESYLYTSEAFARYWFVLSDKGVLYITRTLPIKVEYLAFLEILKIYQSLKKSDCCQDIDKHVAIVKYYCKGTNIVSYSLLLSKSVLSEKDYDRIKSGDYEKAYFPGRDGDLSSLIKRYSKDYDIVATTDDRPYYNNFSMIDRENKYLYIFIFPLLVAVFIYLRQKGSLGLNRVMIFMFLGIGYILLELSLTEKLLLFLENPAYATQVALSSFLFFGGLGGYYGVSVKEKNIRFYLLIVSLLAFLCGSALHLIYRLSFNVYYYKILFVFMLSAPIGFLSAIPFSMLLSRSRVKHIPYAIDAVGTTMGTALAFFVHRFYGFNAGFLVAGLAYLIVLLFIIVDK